MKVQKNNTGERIPPPRPKRKSAHPYPKSKDPPPLSASSSSENNNPNPTSFAHWMASNGLLPDVVSNQHAIELQKSQQEQLQQVL